MESKMDGWNSEHTQLQLTCVTGTAQCRSNYLSSWPVLDPQSLHFDLSLP